MESSGHELRSDTQTHDQDSTWRKVSWWSIRDREGHSQEAMPPNWLARVCVLSTVTACGLDLGGEAFTVAQDPPAADANAPNDPAVDAPANRDSTTIESGGDVAAIAPAVESGPPEDAGATKTQGPLQFDASVADAPPEAEPDPSVEPRTPCERLAKCCQSQATLVPGVKFGCMLGAAQADGGDAGTCASVLMGLTNAGICLFVLSDAGLEE